MGVDTCWKWFSDVFYPEVKNRTGRRALLLLDNAPGHFDVSERDGVKIALFPPNCTSWKQACDTGIIAALNKGY
ncbi:DNA-binding centromere protein B (CENP-B), partial [Plasmopara halstedii]